MQKLYLSSQVSEYMKTSYNSVIKRQIAQLEMDKGFEYAFLQGR